MKGNFGFLYMSPSCGPLVILAVGLDWVGNCLIWLAIVDDMCIVDFWFHEWSGDLNVVRHKSGDLFVFIFGS